MDIIIASFIFPFKWSIVVSLTYSLIQMAIGFYPPPTQDIWSFIAVIMLDYVVAFGILGFAGLFANKIKKTVPKYVVGTVIVTVLRFVCHFLSGILIWKVYAPEGQPAWLYSLLYNGSYMALEIIITTVVVGLIAVPIQKFIKK